MTARTGMAALATLGMASALLAGCSTEYTGANNPNYTGGDPNATVCRDILQPPSNVSRNVCMTNAEWAEYRDNQAAASRELMRSVNNGAVTQPAR